MLLGLLAIPAVACDRSFRFTTAAPAADAANHPADATPAAPPEPARVDASWSIDSQASPPDATLLVDSPVVSFPGIDAAPLPVDSLPTSVPEIDAAPPPIDSPAIPLTPDAALPVDSRPVLGPDTAPADSGKPVDGGGLDTSSLCGTVASCPCVGNACTCGHLQSCDFSGVGCGTGSCSLNCSDGNTCQGQCKDNCKLSCSAGSACTLSMGPNASAQCEGTGVFCVLNVGPNGTVECDDHSNCKVTCTGACKLSCDDTTSSSVCQLRCPGESAFVSGSGTCPRGTSSVGDD